VGDVAEVRAALAAATPEARVAFERIVRALKAPLRP
jgi:microcompartment protein CcmL/EutN